MRGTDSGVNGDDGANGATLAELSEKLTTLRNHLDELLAGHLGGASAVAESPTTSKDADLSSVS